MSKVNPGKNKGVGVQPKESPYVQDFPEGLQSLPSRTYPDSNLKRRISGSNRVKIRSKSGPNQVRGEGFRKGRVQRGRFGWEGSVAPRESLDRTGSSRIHGGVCALALQKVRIYTLWSQCGALSAIRGGPPREYIFALRDGLRALITSEKSISKESCVKTSS